jgi:hypothetical protein
MVRCTDVLTNSQRDAIRPGLPVVVLSAICGIEDQVIAILALYCHRIEGPGAGAKLLKGVGDA